MAKDVTLLIKLNDLASRKLDKITGNTKKLERANNSAQNSIRRINSGIRSTGRAADGASKGVNKLGKAIRGLAAGFGAFQAGKFVIFKTAELERQTKSLEVLTGSLGNARNIIKELQDFGAVTPFTSSELIETAKRLKAFGFETEQVVDVTKRLADVAGATGADLGGIATAFGQIQAKGRLQGEELLQLQERGVNLQDELQKMYGMTADEFRKALEKGRFSADAVNLALQNLTETGGKYANGAIAQSETLAGKFSTLVDSIERIAVVIGNTISPVLKALLDDVTSVTNSIVRMMNQTAMADKVGLSQKEQQKLFRQAGSEAEEIQRRRQGLPATGFAFGALDNDEFLRLRNERFEDLMRQEGFKRGALKAEVSAPTLTGTSGLPKLLSGGGGGGGKTSKTPEEIAAEKAKAIAEASADRVRSLEQQTLLASALTEEERTQFERQIQIADILENKKGRTQEQINAERQATTALFERQDLTKQTLETTKELTAEQQRQIQFAEQIGQTVQSGLVQGIQDAITGSKSLGESLSGILKQVGGMFLNAGIGGLGKSMGIPGFEAEGGYASGATNAVIGEAGPEYVIPESKMRESMARYARGARGSAVIPENGEGGTNSEGGGVSASTLDVRFNVERINSVDYVTASEFQAGMQQAAAQGAQRGQQAALKRLQQSPSTRRRVGI